MGLQRAVSQDWNARTRHGRAVNAVADLLRSKLSVPNIYLSPLIRSIPQVDVLAVDRAGSGDLYVAEIKTLESGRWSKKAMREDILALRKFPAHFKYLALSNRNLISAVSEDPSLFSTDGIGRVGILQVHEREAGPFSAEIALQAERFRIGDSPMDKIDAFLSTKRPDMEVRI